MKKAIPFFLFLFCFLFQFAKAQTTYSKCATQNAMQALEQANPGFINSNNSLFNSFYQSSQTRAISDTFLYVRVVVHVVYNAAAENIADSVVHNQIDILNADYGRLNADSINMRAEFAPITGLDSRIRFVLADTDPQGNPTNGITRTSTTKTSFFSFAGGGLAEDVKSTANGGIDPWDQTRYLNIWVCNMAIPFLGPAVLGYASPPSGLPNWDAGSTAGISDGVVIQFQVFGSNNPTPLPTGATPYVVKGRTPVHEVGHYLGLRHIWGDATNCAGNDGILDTPRATDASQQDCDAVKNTCVDTIVGLDLHDMIENFMDYSAEDCQNSFTRDQANFMRWVILTKRDNVFTPSFVGLPKKSEKAIHTLLPNPANNIVQLQLNPAAFPATVSMFNTAGKLVYSQTYTNQMSISIACENFIPGIYIIAVQSKLGVDKEKLVILH